MPGIFPFVIITKSSKAQQDVQDTLKSHFLQLWICIFDAVTASMLELLFSQDIEITLKCLLSSARYKLLRLPRVPLLEK